VELTHIPQIVLAQCLGCHILTRQFGDLARGSLLGCHLGILRQTITESLGELHQALEAFESMIAEPNQSNGSGA
jgi:hypothetical protein